MRPLLTGIGLAPQSAANAASLRSRSMFWPAVTSSVPAWPAETPTRAVVTGAVRAMSCLGCRSRWAISLSRSTMRPAIERSAALAAC